MTELHRQEGIHWVCILRHPDTSECIAQAELIQRAEPAARLRVVSPLGSVGFQLFWESEP